MRLSKNILLILVLIALIISVPVRAENEDKKSPSTDKNGAGDDGTTRAARQIEERFGICEDETLNEKLKRVSEKIVNVLTDEEKITDFTFKVLDEDEVNAFALPDGQMYFFKGLVELSKTDDQLAGVVAHELTHVIHKHSKHIAKESLPWLVGGILVGVVADEPGAAIAGDWVAQAQAQKYTRKAEEDADRFGLQLVIRAGYNPIGMLEFFNFMVEEEKRNPFLYQKYFFTHPFAHERISELKKILISMGYKVPDSLYRSYLESSIETREENGTFLIDIIFDKETLFTIADTNKLELEERAENITLGLKEILDMGATRFDFRIVKDADRAWIQAKGRTFYEPTSLDIEKSGMDRDALLKQILAKIKQLLLEEQIKRRV